jgi:cytidylate kinase
MNTPMGFDKCLNFISCQMQPAGHPALVREQPKRAVTISRQSGCGAHAVAEELAAWLQARSPQGDCPWTVFDRNLMEKVLEEHHLPERLAKFIPEDRITQFDDIMSELFGLRPGSWTLVEQTAETILHLAGLGHVILLGRGANVVTASLPGMVHVLLVAPLEKRVENMQQFEKLTRPAARKRIQQEDHGRRRYLKKYFGRDIEDPLLYHLVINTGFVPLAEAARLIGELVLSGKSG